MKKTKRQVVERDLGRSFTSLYRIREELALSRRVGGRIDSRFFGGVFFCCFFVGEGEEVL